MKDKSYDFWPWSLGYNVVSKRPRVAQGRNTIWQQEWKGGWKYSVIKMRQMYKVWGACTTQYFSCQEEISPLSTISTASVLCVVFHELTDLCSWLCLDSRSGAWSLEKTAFYDSLKSYTSLGTEYKPFLIQCGGKYTMDWRRGGEYY